MANPTEPSKVPAPKPEPAKAEMVKSSSMVRIRTLAGEVLDLSAHNLGMVTSEGRDYSADDADKVRMLARKAHVSVKTREVEK